MAGDHRADKTGFMPVSQRLLDVTMRRIGWLTLKEWLVIVAILVTLIAILWPQVKWASSGDIDFPVRVFVFDAEARTPIAGAQVAFFRAPPHSHDDHDDFLKDFGQRFTPELFDSDRNHYRGETDAHGESVITYKFRTGASHRRPMPHAHTSWVWAAVRAEGYGGSVVQVRQESIATSQLQTQKELCVPIGLIKTNK